IDLLRHTPIDQLKLIVKDVDKKEVRQPSRQFKVHLKAVNNIQCSTISQLKYSTPALLKRNSDVAIKEQFICAAIISMLTEASKETLLDYSYEDMHKYFLKEFNHAQNKQRTEKGYSSTLLKNIYKYIIPCLLLTPEQINQLSVLVSRLSDEVSELEKTFKARYREYRATQPTLSSYTQMTQSIQHAEEKPDAYKKRNMETKPSSDKKPSEEEIISQELSQMYSASNIFSLTPDQKDHLSLYTDWHFITYYLRTTTLGQFKKKFQEDSEYQFSFFDTDNISFVSLIVSLEWLLQKDENKLIKRHFIEAAILVILQETKKETLEKIVFEDLVKFFSLQSYLIKEDVITNIFKKINNYLIPLLTQFNQEQKHQLQHILCNRVSQTQNPPLSLSKKFNFFNKNNSFVDLASDVGVTVEPNKYTKT
ncbi:MAG: hypothetical protein JO131_03085, partial [Gammaproteobacteria bacterium]|nr:hypothetical protein [Gammaproteobacteria bacterium]